MELLDHRRQSHLQARKRSALSPTVGVAVRGDVGFQLTDRTLSDATSASATMNGCFGVARRRRVDSRHRGHPSQCGPEPVIYLDRFDFQLAVIGIAVSMPKEWANGSAMPFVQSIGALARAVSSLAGVRPAADACDSPADKRGG